MVIFPPLDDYVSSPELDEVWDVSVVALIPDTDYTAKKYNMTKYNYRKEMLKKISLKEAEIIKNTQEVSEQVCLSLTIYH